MKSLLTILFVLLAIPVMAQDGPGGVPFTYECIATEGVRIEEDFCDLLLTSMLRTELVRAMNPDDKGSLNMVVLPLQDDTDPDRMAASITMSITLPRDKDENILVYSRIDILGYEDLHDDEMVDAVVSVCINGVTDWLKKAIGGASPQDEFAALRDRSDA